MPAQCLFLAESTVINGMLSPYHGGAAGRRGGTCAKHRSSALASQDPLLETSDRLLSAEQLLIQLV